MEIEIPSAPIVDCHWLKQHLNHPKLVLIDAYMEKIIGIEALKYQQQLVIPGAMRINIESQLCDPTQPQSHAMPSQSQFDALMVTLNIASDALIVIYDQQGIYSAPRAWYTFTYMGFDNVVVLNGGLPAWLAANYAVTDRYIERHSNNNQPIKACIKPAYLIERNQLHELVKHGLSTPLIDVRSRERFFGLQPEPREGVRSGHIPGARNLPFTLVLRQRRYKSVGELKALFDSYVNQPADAIIYSCGSGITACIVLLAGVLASYPHACLYNGSWAEWGADDTLPIAVN